MKLILFICILLMSCGEDLDCRLHGEDCALDKENRQRIEDLESKEPVVIRQVAQPGPQGPAGKDGKDGLDGKNGVDGTPGRDGEDAIVSIIDPCIPGGERLFVLSTGCIAVYFKESTKKEYLTCLEDGDYVTTDSEACKFSIQNGEYLEN